MSNKFSNIKSRIVEYIDYQGIPKGNFFKNIGMTPQSFRGDAINTAINSDALAKLLSIHKDINPYWLILGEGKMLLENNNMVREGPSEYLSEKDANEIKKLEQDLRDKEKIIEYLESLLGVQKQPKAGKAS